MNAAALAMPENGPGGLREHVRALSADLQLSVSHYPDSRRCWLKGEPDLRFYTLRKIVHVELKAEDGDLSPEQRRLRYRILAFGGDWRLWTPTDLLSGRIAAELNEIRSIR